MADWLGEAPDVENMDDDLDLDGFAETLASPISVEVLLDDESEEDFEFGGEA